MVVYEVVEQSGSFNDTLAAGASEVLVTTPDRVPYFNFLIIQNFDPNTNISILLDAGTDKALAIDQGKLYQAQLNGGTLILNPEDGVKFKQVAQVNDDSADAEGTNTISFLWGYKKRIG